MRFGWQIRFVTARLKVVKDGKVLGMGTGFFYKHYIGGDKTKAVPLLVTNKHVIGDADSVRILVHEGFFKDDEPEVRGAITVDLAGEWIDLI